MKNKIEEVKNKYKVAIYIKYEEGNLNQMKIKEEILNEYCKKNNYDIVKKFFDNEENDFQYFSNTMKALLKDVNGNSYYSLIACDVDDFSYDLEKLICIYKILDDEDILIETINQGQIGNDMLLGGHCFLNVLNKKEFVDKKIIYKSNGEIVDLTNAPF